MYKPIEKMSLKINDVLERISSHGKQKTVEFLIEQAEYHKIPIANKRSFSKSCDNILSKFKALRKNISLRDGQSNIDEFKSGQYTFPKPNTTTLLVRKGQKCSENIVELQNNVETFKHVSYSLAKELKESKDKEQALQLKLEAKNSRIGKTRQQLKHELQNANLEVKNLKNQNKVLHARLLKKRTAILRQRSSIQYLNKSLNKAKELLQQKQEIVTDLQGQVRLLKDEYADLFDESMRDKAEVNDVVEENQWLKDVIDDNTQNEVVKLYNEETRMYTKELQVCVYSLLENHVSAKHVGAVINTVLALLQKKANKVPSISTVHSMNLQRLVLSQKQIAEVVSVKTNMSIYTDETSKFGKKVTGYHVRDQEGNYFTLGLRELATKSASDTMDTFREILTDIDNVAESADDASRKILTNITCTMSDSAATEVKFNSILEEYRAAVLPYTLENYNELDENAKLSVSRMMNFFCGLHSLVHFAETCSKAVIEVEKQIFNDKAPIDPGSFKKENESGTVRLIRTASKAFSRGGDEKSGCHLPFVTFISDYLKANKIRSLKLVPFKGNRFNILFHNAGQVYLMHNKMQEFLKGLTLNRLTKSVAFDLSIPSYIAGCKALGLVSKFISTPLWNLLEDKTINILDMDRYYFMLKSGLLDASNNVSEFMMGKLRPFQDSVEVNEDLVYNALIEPSTYDTECETFLAVILSAMAKYVENKFKDFLPGGVYSNVSEEMKLKASSVEKHNKFSERVFAYFDNLLRYKPNIHTLASEAYVAFAVNKTGSWLNGKTEREIEVLVSNARKEVKSLQKQFKQRQTTIMLRRQEKLEKERRERAEAEARKLEEQQTITNNVIFYGLWQTEEQVENMLGTIKTKQEKIKALKAQLKFRKEIFKQKPEDGTVYLYSKKVENKTVQLSVEELSINVKKLISHATRLPSTSDEEHRVLLGQRVRHKFTEDDEDTWYTGTVISQV